MKEIEREKVIKTDREKETDRQRQTERDRQKEQLRLTLTGKRCICGWPGIIPGGIVKDPTTTLCTLGGRLGMWGWWW